jgi:hypothetical protein
LDSSAQELKPSGKWKLMPTAGRCWPATSQMPTATEMSKSVSADTRSEPLMCSPEDSLVSLLLAQGNERARQILAGSGRKCFELFRHSGHRGSWQRILLESWLLDFEQYSVAFTHRWILKAMKSCPSLFQLQRLERRTKDIGCLLWPTLTASDATGGGSFKEKRKASGHSVTLRDFVKTWPTLRATERGSYQRDRGEKGKERLTLMGMMTLPTATVVMHKGSSAGALTRKNGKSRLNDRLDYAIEGDGTHGRLNPQWLDWYMGFPIGWTELPRSETPSCRKSRSTSGAT